MNWKWKGKSPVFLGTAAWLFLFEGIGGMLVGMFFLLHNWFAAALSVPVALSVWAGWLHLLRGILFSLTSLEFLSAKTATLGLLAASLLAELVAAYFWVDSLFLWVLRIGYLPLVFGQLRALV